MNVADRFACGHCVAVTAILVALACPGCSSTGDAHHHASPVSAHRDTVTPSEVRTEAPAVAAEKKSVPAPVTRAEADLQRGIRSYEDAEYEIARKNLRSALARGLKAPEDKAKAHKYLAFVDCTSGRMKSCHAEFRNALQVDPTFDLAPAEAGHPIWGPVFRNAKLEVNGKARTRPAYAAQ